MNFKDKFSKEEKRVNTEDPAMSDQLSTYLQEWLPPSKEIVIACIGTDRSTGDSFGPLVGSMLHDHPFETFHIYGTLEEPLHALNLKERLTTIRKNHPNPYILAIDACLGKSSSVGSVILGKGSLSPGSALKKDLPPVGQLHISGMVNVSGFMEHVVLQNTRLHIVMKMAAKVAAAIQLTEAKRKQVYMESNPIQTFTTSSRTYKKRIP
ncbi:putative sporulation protein YyaC [Halobacillus karajensis]|uniref:Sporulation protein YyaC n=1 Tax=Halobacillus karajensis TaxID=195088 RepID=A0A059NXK5_9BACI|nr:spore protease YyaC [Halobacillus karajensis]CDQ18413.1 putative sporulation protein YyaC [Halobacillus karajensis]CDQ23515.1 putative sporulation protein YyaC [Halobacillus karajensis]CDQ26997.1 putative sporulation protein YyaC [Halobacillus karajensis]SEH51718.1 putative sporulation protein YyaC [Halobacillus karajensis]